MQVQHELSLLDATQAKVLDTSNKSLDTYCLQAQLSNSMNPIEHLVVSPSNSNAGLLACHLSQINQIQLFDMRTRKRRDKFPLKAYDKQYSRQSFQVSGLDFSPDGQRLAVGQTDCVIYIYKLATLPAGTSSISSKTGPSSSSNPNSAVNYDDQSCPLASLKPTITGKFSASSPITCMRWSDLGIIFGSQDGRVRLILSFNKPAASQLDHPLSQTNPQSSSQSSSPKVISLLASAKKGSTPISLAYRSSVLVVGQTDFSVSVLQLAQGTTTVDLPAQSMSEQPGQLLGVSALTMIAPGGEQAASSSIRRSSSIGAGQSLGVVSSTSFEHSCPPEHLLLIASNNPTGLTTICCAGSDGRIGFHSLRMQDKRNLLACSLQQAIDLNEDVMSMDYSSINEVLVLASRSRLVFVKYDQETGSWRLQPSTIELRNVYTLASVRWLREGSHLAVGCSSNSLELFKCVWSKQSVNDNLDICHIARNRIRITDRERNLLATYKTQADIKRVNLLDQGQNVLIWTTTTLLVAKLGNQRLQSEIKWRPDQKASGTKFLFDANSTFVLIYDGITNELSLLKLGQSSVSLTIKFPQGQRVRRDLVSVGQFDGAAQQATQSPNRLRQTSSRTSSASNNQRQRNSSLSGLSTAEITTTSQADETPISIEPTISGGSTAAIDSSLLERFAYVLPSTNQLNVIDLMDSNRLLFSQRYDKPIEWIAFSFTSRYLAFRCASGGLNLLSFEAGEAMKQAGSSQELLQSGTIKSGVRVKINVLLGSCDGLACWLPESDSLVAQSGPIIRIWYDLTSGSEARHQRYIRTSETFDTRTFNYNNRQPLLDLSGPEPGGGKPRGKRYPTLVRVSGSGGLLSLVLSNERTIDLDKIQTSFHAKLAVDSLDEALELLENYNPNSELQSTGGDSKKPTSAKTKLRPLFAKLGWLALEREGKCELARRSFAHLDYRKLVKFLEQCLSESGEQRRELQLAKLRADWIRFEQLAQDQEEIAATYRRLNKWTQLIDYLTRRQQFRQRDLAEQDHLRWLIESGRRVEAAKLSIRLTGNLQSALELLLESRDLVAAADLLLKEQRLPLKSGPQTEPASSQANILTASERKLRHLVEYEIRDKLLEAGRGSSKLWLKAAEISEKILGESNKALELYLNGQNFELALDLLRRHQNGALNQSDSMDCSPARIKQVELQFADFLRQQFLSDPLMGVSRKRATQSIDLYLSAGHHSMALQMANLLRMPERGLSVLERMGGVEIVGDEQRKEFQDECNKLGWLLIAVGHDEAKRKAALAFEAGEHFEQLAELLLELKEFDGAFRLVLERINNKNRELTESQFIALADELWKSARGQEQEAELIYVLANRAELAIGMYEQLGEHEKMLDLVEQHQADQLEGKLLQLAKQLESSGQLEEAEKYLMRASPSEWTNVVRMYRLANRWPEAYRVARANCISERDPLLVQLAYWWAKSLQADNASVWRDRRSLLNKLGLLKQVVEFCCETKNFHFALELLDDEGDVKKAGDSHQGDQFDGVEPSNGPSGEIRREVILRYATFLEQQQKLDQAERLLVANDLSELAVKMYTDNDDYESAIRVIETQLSQSGAINSGGNQAEIVDKRQQALNELLNATLVECARRLVAGVTPANSRGAHLMSRPQSRTSNTLNSSGSTAERLQAAQQMFLRAQRPELAVEMYQSLGMWREAIQVAQRFAPRLLEGVERALDELVSDDLGSILVAAGQTPPEAENLTTEANGQEQEELADEVVSNEDELSNGIAPEVRVWRQFELNLSQGKQAAAGRDLAAYLVQLIGQPTSTSKQLRPLERYLVEARKQRSPKASAIVSDREITLKLLKLADKTLGSELSLLERNADEIRLVWLSWRNILASYAKLLTGSVLPGEAPEIERRLLAAHFVVLQCSLAQSLLGSASTGSGTLSSSSSIRQVLAIAREAKSEPALRLLAKVSFSLLRYADLIDVKSALWLAGLWQLAAGRRQMARTIWALLIELTDRVTGGDDATGAELMRTKLGQFVDVPEQVLLEAVPTPTTNSMAVQRLNQVRQWLLESLIEGDNDHRRAPGAEESLPRGWARLSGLCCLASGLPAAPPSGAPSNGGDQARILVGACEKRAAARCDELLELIGLCGINRAADQSRLDGGQLTKLGSFQELRQLIGSELESRRRVVAGGGAASQKLPRSRHSTRPDQLVEIIDFLLGL